MQPNNIQDTNSLTTFLKESEKFLSTSITKIKEFIGPFFAKAALTLQNFYKNYPIVYLISFVATLFILPSNLVIPFIALSIILLGYRQ